ncbi:M16 family metallopeptidase [Pseudanabaena mucicola]|uniref:Insulinase family protein n=1 Tax=Pseudanabaena mucicola FACHB-723 TaxID=2692860 RepID=A0ABR7ZSA4_9CYAN|nr:pitrilysin family protein [Pseudanabaena mucicola]MBD2186844.1 insulinase family protein [Pseudanabaena mucicola FACHB-723]
MPAIVVPRRLDVAASDHALHDLATDNSTAPTQHILPNGIKIIAEQVPVDAVNLSIWVDVGSAVESDDINGMAHFLEHMVFKGSERLGLGEFEQAIESHGGNTNAATSQDYTHFYINVAPQDFAKLAPLQLDIVLKASIPDEEFQRERHVVLEEIRRSEDNPDRRIYRHISELVYEQLPYRRAVLGPVEVIEKVTAEQMRSFHRQWYAPQNMTIAVVGNLPVAEMIGVIADYFAEDAIAVKPQAKTFMPEKPFTEIVRREVVDSSLKQARLSMTWRVAGINELEATYPLSILANILGSGRTSRMVQDLRENRRICDRISVSNSAMRWQGTFQVFAKLNVEDVEVVEQAIREHIQHLHDHLVTDEELAKIRTQVSNRFIFGNESPRERAGIYGYYDRIVGSLAHALNYPDRIKSITKEDIQAAVRKYLNPDAYGILIVKP